MERNAKKTIGFVISHKENEKRRALLPSDIQRIEHRSSVYIEEGYGSVLHISDNEYCQSGCSIVSRRIALQQDIICDPKIGDAEYLIDLHPGQIVFGWLHAVQNTAITDTLISNKLTAYAWEEMYESGRHSFWRNNEIAGEAAIMHAFRCYGAMPYNTKVALVGNGNVARGACKILTLLGADLTVFNRKTEKLFQHELSQFDVIVNAVKWDTSRTDHLVWRDDLKRMKKGSMIVDISCDKNGGIESSFPTTITDPVYEIDGVLHYVVDHTPSLFYKTVSIGLSQEVSRYTDMLIEDCPNQVLSDACIIANGEILDSEIRTFQKR